MGKRIIIVVAIAASLTMSLSGCSVIMYGLGSHTDASLPDSVYVPDCPIDTLRKGLTIHVIRTEGDTISGKFLGTEPPLPREYYDETYGIDRENKFAGFTQVQSLMIRCDKDTSLISIDEIEGILWYPKKNAKYIGLAIGAYIDALIIYGIATWEYNLSFSSR